MRRLTTLLTMLLAGCLMRTAGAADDAGLEFFEKKIRPLLVTHCYECHSADSKKLGGDLRLDDAECLGEKFLVQRTGYFFSINS